MKKFTKLMTMIAAIIFIIFACTKPENEGEPSNKEVKNLHMDALTSTKTSNGTIFKYNSHATLVDGETESPLNVNLKMELVDNEETFQVESFKLDGSTLVRTSAVDNDQTYIGNNTYIVDWILYVEVFHGDQQGIGLKLPFQQAIYCETNDKNKWIENPDFTFENHVFNKENLTIGEASLDVLPASDGYEYRLYKNTLTFTYPGGSSTINIKRTLQGSSSAF